MAAGTGLTSVPGTTVYTNGITSTTTVNYVVASGSSSNALTANLTAIDGSAVALSAGLRILLKTDATLQAGANTLTLNSGSAKSIKNINSNNLKTTVAVGAILDLAYDGTNWQMLNSTY